MKALFIGGTGNISSACVELALAQGIEVTLLNRGTSGRPVPNGAQVVNGDIRDPQSVRAALGSRSFDVVAEFVAFTPSTSKPTWIFPRAHRAIYLHPAQPRLIRPRRLSCR